KLARDVDGDQGHFRFASAGGQERMNGDDINSRPAEDQDSLSDPSLCCPYGTAELQLGVVGLRVESVLKHRANLLAIQDTQVVECPRLQVGETASDRWQEQARRRLHILRIIEGFFQNVAAEQHLGKQPAFLQSFQTRSKEAWRALAGSRLTTEQSAK